MTHDAYRPFQVVAFGAPDPKGTAVPLLQDGSLVDGRTAAYVCVNFTCRIPVTEPDALRLLLNKQ